MNPVLAAMLVGAFLTMVVIVLLVRISAGKATRHPPEPSSTKQPRKSLVPPKDEVLSGGLQHMALADLLQFLAQGGHTGTLQLTSGRRSGTIRLVQGLVVHSEFRRQYDLDALFELLSLQIGDFHFQFEPQPTEPVRGREVVDILMLWLEAKEESK
jgi:hypothetical protein